MPMGRLSEAGVNQGPMARSSETNRKRPRLPRSGADPLAATSHGVPDRATVIAGWPENLDNFLLAGNGADEAQLDLSADYKSNVACIRHSSNISAPTGPAAAW